MMIKKPSYQQTMLEFVKEQKVFNEVKSVKVSTDHELLLQIAGSVKSIDNRLEKVEIRLEKVETRLEKVETRLEKVETTQIEQGNLLQTVIKLNNLKTK
jgi:septal ring factor EnvC (AmiA/AmiB activator)